MTIPGSWSRRGAVALLDHVPSGVAARFTSSGAGSRVVRPIVNRLLPHGLTAVTVRSGVAAGLRLNIDPRGEKFYWTGAYETPVQEFLASQLEPGHVFWDIGAHIGFFSAVAARLVGSSGAVHAFEPLPANRARLETTIAANDLENVIVHGLAVGATSGDRSFEPHSSSGMGHLTEATENSVRVECRSIDDLARSLPPPNVVKIDVEGSEIEVLAGAEHLLKRSRPVILVEFHDRGAVARAQALLPEATMASVDDVHWSVSFPASRREAGSS